MTNNVQRVTGMQYLKKKCVLAVKNWQIYLLILPGLIYYFVFVLGPVWGLSIAFYDYNQFRGIAGSEFVWFKNFTDFFNSSNFAIMLRNTLVISFMNLVFYFPAPIILSLFLNEVRVSWFKRLSQTIVYLPHFLSWVVIGGFTVFLLSTDVGIVNKMLLQSGGEPFAFLSSASTFWWVILFQVIWKEVGWGTILFLAAMTRIDPGLYEASMIDGAGKLSQIFYITIPGIMPTITILFIMRMGNLLNVSFEQILIMYNAAVRSVAEVFDTYVYRMGVQLGEYSIGASVGLFKSVVGLIMVVSANKVIKKLGYSGIY